jgi:hypothetical protein
MGICWGDFWDLGHFIPQIPRTPNKQQKKTPSKALQKTITHLKRNNCNETHFPHIFKNYIIQNPKKYV